MTATLRPELLDHLVSPAEASRQTGWSQSTIRSWISRKHLEPAGLDRHGRKLYRFVDILRVEMQTRKQALGEERGKLRPF